MILKVIIFYTYLLKIKNACHKNQRKKSRIIIQKNVYCGLVCCYYKDMLHKLPALSGLKGNFDCIFKEMLSR